MGPTPVFRQSKIEIYANRKETEMNQDLKRDQIDRARRHHRRTLESAIAARPQGAASKAAELNRDLHRDQLRRARRQHRQEIVAAMASQPR
jgi:hypothetical protein